MTTIKTITIEEFRSSMTLEEQKNIFSPWRTGDFVVPDGCSLHEIGSHFVLALYYGDIDALSDEDAEQLAAFIEDNGDNVVDSVDYDDFGECCITGLRGRTSLVVIRSEV